MKVEIEVKTGVNIEILYDGKEYKILMGFPQTTYLLGEGLVQYFVSRERSISVRNIRSVFTDISVIDSTAMLHKGGIIDRERFMLSIDGLIKNKKLLLRDKTFLKRLLTKHEKELPETFGYVLIQNGYAKHLDELKFKAPDKRFRLSCDLFKAALDKLPQALARSRMEEQNGSKTL